MARASQERLDACKDEVELWHGDLVDGMGFYSPPPAHMVAACVVNQIPGCGLRCVTLGESGGPAWKGSVSSPTGTNYMQGHADPAIKQDVPWALSARAAILEAQPAFATPASK